MIDPIYLRDGVEQLRQALTNRGADPASPELDALVALEAERRRLLPELENLKRDQNAAGEEVAKAKRQGLDTSAIQEANKVRSGLIKDLAAQLDEVEARRQASLLAIPNVPHATVPVGRSADDNAEVRRVGTPRAYDFTPQALFNSW